MAEPMISHRGPEFEAIHKSCENKLQNVFGTRDEVVIISGMGYAAIETAIANCVQDDDTVVCHQNGKFGHALEDIADRYAGETTDIIDEWGTPPDLNEIEAALEAGADVLTMVHAETTTGMVNPIEKVGKLTNEHDALFVVDGVTSIGGEQIDLDESGVDIATTASQKCVGAPAGLSALSLSEAARDRIDSGSAPYYFDLEEYRSKAEINQTPTTAVVQLFRALENRLESIEAEGVDQYIQRMATRARALREAGWAMGLDQFSTLDQHTKYSNAVTVYEVPEELTTDEIIKGMRARNVEIRGGLKHLYDESIRIGTMGGAIEQREVLTTVEALQGVLESSSFDLQGDGVDAAKSVFD
jgi:aspartate aminotransferase-like enzyme